MNRENRRDPVRIPTNQANQGPQPTEYVLVRVKIFRLEDYQISAEDITNMPARDIAKYSATQRFEDAVNEYVVKKQIEGVKHRIPVNIQSMPGEIHIQYGEVRPID